MGVSLSYMVVVSSFFGLSSSIVLSVLSTAVEFDGARFVANLAESDDHIPDDQDEVSSSKRFLPEMSKDSLVPSCFVIYDLELFSLSFDFVFSSEIFKSLSIRLDRLFHLTILCLIQYAHTLYHLESLLTISLDRLDIFEGGSYISEFVRKSLSLILELS
ncbi:hypothetical protein Tco_1357628 [Tanacetum coccineum]